MSFSIELLNKVEKKEEGHNAAGTEGGRVPAANRTPAKATGQYDLNLIEDGENPVVTQAGQQQLVFADPVAFRYLEEDPSTIALERRRELTGYELYIVEQWACSRTHPTFVITTFTGLPQHKVLVGVLSVPTDEGAWSPRLRIYLKAISQFHARKKETQLGTLMVTNLSGFPSALTVIPVPGGDVRDQREGFIVNEDLKRLGCSGRAGMNLLPPTVATQAKFNQLYRTSDRVPLRTAVIELVTLCQATLVIFEKLAPEYTDGLICDVTEKAINDWWTEIGTEWFNVEPSDGILGPTTVAAMLGLLVGARNRLNAYGAPVAKDAFDLKVTKRAIGYFQKSQKLTKTRRLDRQTLKRLHKVTSKAANGEGWAVPRAVKSTVAELSGKGGEMVMGMVGAREKKGIAEVETLDIGVFIQMASGERCKWLWQGKPRKHHQSTIINSLAAEEEKVFSGDENAGYIWSSRKRDSVAEQSPIVHGNLDHLYMQPSQNSHTSLNPSDKDLASRKTVFQSVTGKMNDAKNGLGRFKDAVGITGFRGHNHKYAKENTNAPECDELRRLPTPSRSTRGDSETPPQSLVGDVPSQNGKVGFETPGAHPGDTSRPKVGGFVDVHTHNSPKSYTDAELVLDPNNLEGLLQGGNYENVVDASNLDRPVAFPNFRSLQGSERHVEDSATQRQHSAGHQGIFASPGSPDLRGRQSFDQLLIGWPGACAKDQWPRHLSFSNVEDVQLRAKNAIGTSSNEEKVSLENVAGADVNDVLLSLQSRQMAIQLQQLENRDTVSVQHRVRDIDNLDKSAGRDYEDLTALYYQRVEESNALHHAMTELVIEEKSSLAEALKEVEVLGAKLEYELSALQSKIEDVEEGVAELERQVSELEGRADTLESKENSGYFCSGFILRYFLRK